MQPIDYSIQAKDPTESFVKSFQLGAGLRQADLQSKAAEFQQQQMQKIAELTEKAQRPGATAEDYKALSLMLPAEQAKSVRETYALANESQNSAALQRGGQLLSALQAGNSQVSDQLFADQIEARRRDGDEEGAKALSTWRDVAKESPQVAADFFAMQMSLMPGGDKVLDNVLKQRKAPAEMAGMEVDTQLKQAEIGLKNAETSLKIAQAAAKRAESSGGKSEEAQLKLDKARLDLQEARNAAAEKKLQKDFEGKDALLKLDTAINTVDRILTNPNLDDVVGTFDQWEAFGEAEKKVASDIDTLKSQAFLAQLPGMRGFGALSEGDRLALTTAIGNINRGVSEKDFRNEMGNIKSIFQKMKTLSGERYGIEGQQPESVNVGNKTYTKPANFTDAQWSAYKASVGAK